MSEALRVELCSPPDREKLVAAIMLNGEQFAEINQESDNLIVEFFPRIDGKPWNLRLDDLIHAITVAKQRLGLDE